MDNLSRRFNEMMLKEMGYDVLSDGTLIDQDLGIPIIFDGVPVVGPAIPIQKGDTSVVPFDPYNNSRMMFQSFNQFVDKMIEIEGIQEYDVLYNEDCTDGGGVITIKNEEFKLSSSRPYLRESCKYADLIFQLNEDEVPDMKDFDIPKAKQRDMIKKEQMKNKKGGKKKK